MEAAVDPYQLFATRLGGLVPTLQVGKHPSPLLPREIAEPRLDRLQPRSIAANCPSGRRTMAIARAVDGCSIHWIEEGAGPAILLVHGFASTHARNWVETGWTKAIARAGWRAIAYDLRGHGASDKRYDPAEYAPPLMVSDADAVLDAARASSAVLMGYSMGARIVLEIALARAGRARALVLGGIGANFRDFGKQEDEREIVARALEAEDPSVFPPAARFYRTFADQTGQDRRALAACWRRPIRTVTPSELATVAVPTLVVAGDRDTVAGDPGPLAAAIPGTSLVRLAGKDHMNAVGAREHRAVVLDFLSRLGALAD
jgi:pimeloyl-ACP methyl ester carboxylesterase